MPDYDPPARYDGRPNRTVLPSGHVLWRLHKHSRKATEFCRQAEPALPANRFNGPVPYPTVNAGSDAGSTVAERLLLTVPDDGQFRTVRRVRVQGMRASAVATAVDLNLVSLITGVDLSAVAQDMWLVTAQDCPRIARWTDWLREKAPWANGFVWPAARDARCTNVVLFDDRCGAEVLEPNPRFEVDLQGELGATWLNWVLVHHNARINPPARRAAS